MDVPTISRPPGSWVREHLSGGLAKPVEGLTDDQHCTTPLRQPPEGDALMAISKRVRYEILRRDNNTCRYCHAIDTPLTIDHVVPTVLGGTDDPSNLVAACKDCNAGKSSSSPDAATVAQVSDEQLRWGRAVQLAAQRALTEHDALLERLDPFFDYWYSLVPGFRRGNPRWELPSNWAGLVAGLLAAGMPDALITDSMRIALTTRGVDDRFRYFLGIARNRLAELHEQAQKLIEDGKV